MVAKAQEFLREAKAELMKVTWPDRKVAAASTAVVVIVSLIIGIYLGILDVILGKIFEWVFR
ncbi:preprotein translocase subunit SecE [bacterium]|nr:MAG: preprotein translocase subunit SecE [bacterium]